MNNNFEREESSLGTDGHVLQFEGDEQHGSPADTTKKVESVLETVDEDDNVPASIPSTVCALIFNLIPTGGMLASGINLASTSVGAGIVGMPAGFSSVGLLMAVAYLIGVTAETAYSMSLLAEVSERTGLKSFEDLARYLVHSKGHVFVAIIRILHTLGGTVVYVVTIRDLVSPILGAMDNVPSFYTSAVGLRVIQTVLFLIFMLPLVIPRFINAMRYVSAVAIVFIIYLSVIVIVHSCTNGLQGKGPKPEISLARTGNGALNGMGVFIFSYMCQINCLEIYYEMTKRSVKRFAICCWISMSVCCGLYIMTGLFGYLDFGNAIGGSVLLEYNPIEEPAVLVCYIGVFIKICASFSLVSFACRSALFPLLGWDPKTVPFRKHLLGSMVMAFINLLLGVFVPNISLVLSFFGGFCGGQVGFILPALFAMYAGGWSFKSVGFFNYIATYAMLCVGVLAVVVGTASTVYSVAISGM